LSITTVANSFVSSSRVRKIWAHIFLTRELDTNELATVVIDNSPIGNGICECRCCLLSGTMC
ncbi:unnamed protein product, partial [Rotaria sp. Silwood2]